MNNSLAKIMKRGFILGAMICMMFSISAVAATTAKTYQTKSTKITVKKAANNQAQVQWKKVSGAKGYLLYVSTKKNSGFKKVATIKSSISSRYTMKYTGHKYYFIVKPYFSYNGKTIYGKSSNVGFAQSTKRDGMINIAGTLYYYKDGVTVKNKTIQGKKFDKNGKYTTGDAKVDAYIRNTTKVVTAGKKTQEEKLKAVFNFAKKQPYMPSAFKPAAGKTGFATKCVKLFITGKDMQCYGYASLVKLLASNIGYEAKEMSGYVYIKPSVTARVHAWTEIKISGKWYYFDANFAGIGAPAYATYKAQKDNAYLRVSTTK